MHTNIIYQLNNKISKQLYDKHKINSHKPLL
jgi:hypothetical protein